MSTASWENRRLCDDGGCTGLIGGDGVCSVCGRPVKFWGDERRRGMQDDDEVAASSGAGAADAGDSDVDDRALCPDGSCTGVLDRDGRCKVCGKVDPDAVGRARASAASAVRGGDEGDDAGLADDADDDEDDDADDGDGDDRALCPDGGCTGLIGADGACKVCGRRAEA